MSLSRTLPFSSLSFRYSVVKVFKRNVFSFKYRKPKKVTSCDKALMYYDDYYKSIFKNLWPSIRLGLLTKEKYVAVINNFGDVNGTKELLESQGAYDLRTFLEYQKKYVKDDLNQPEHAKRNDTLIETIKQKVKLTEEAEWNEIYSPEKNIPVSSSLYENSESNRKTKAIEDTFIYDPEEATTSLKADVSRALIDEGRLILPSSLGNKNSLYEFVPATKLRGLEEYISETEYYKYYKDKSEYIIDVQPEYNLNFLKHFWVYTFDRGDVSEFLPPSRKLNGVYDYVLMNGADLLTVLALDIQPNDVVLNMLSNSQVQAFCILQTLVLKRLICNKSKNIESFFTNHLHDYSPNWKNLLSLVSIKHLNDPQMLYNKILLDVFCTDDRGSLSNLNDNYFTSLRKTERLQLPSFQAALLTKALKSVQIGGTVIYTTKTMCPIQNDGVVSEALKTVWEEKNLKFCVKDMSPALEHTKLLYHYGSFIGLKYGTLVLPFLPSNFGPRYFAKIVRME